MTSTSYRPAAASESVRCRILSVPARQTFTWMPVFAVNGSIRVGRSFSAIVVYRVSVSSAGSGAAPHPAIKSTEAINNNKHEGHDGREGHEGSFVNIGSIRDLRDLRELRVCRFTAPRRTGRYRGSSTCR